ncbi:MAG: WD40 repeat domain-containing protein [Cyclobacteriaceae bacterium]|jgi:WD40 repeat protein|nr:WD40 repeat domain-containing protein [Cyclobacteriaceae bacterium]
MSAIKVEKLHTLTGHRDCVYTVVPSDFSNIFFSGGGDGMIVKWDLSNPAEGELIARLPNSIYSLCAIPNSNLLIAGHNYEGIHMLDWKEKKEVASLQMTKGAIFDIQYFENDLLIATGEGALVIVDLENRVIKRKLALSQRSARVLAVNPIQNEVAIGFSDNAIRIYSLLDYTLKYEFEAHRNSVFTLSYTHDYKFLISGSRDARLKAWQVDSGYKQTNEVAAHLFAINHIAFSPSGEYFATASMDKSIKIWKADELKLLKVIDKGRHAGHGTSVNKLVWTDFKNQLVSASDDRTISVWDLRFDS